MKHLACHLWAVMIIWPIAPEVCAQQVRIVSVGTGKSASSRVPVTGWRSSNDDSASTGHAAPDEAPTSAAAKGQGPSAKFCPTCKHLFPANQRFCSIDGVPLAEAEAKRQNAKLCPRCKQLYDSGAKFCAQDGAPLVDSVPKIETKVQVTPKRAGPTQSAVPLPTDSIAATSKSSSPSADEPQRAPCARTTPYVGAAYVHALRSTLVPTHRSRDETTDEAERLGEVFRLARRLAVAFQFETSSPSLHPLVERLEAELRRRIRVAASRDVELVPIDALAASPGWKRILLRVSLTEHDHSDSPIRSELKLCEVEFVPTPDEEQELSEELDSGARSREQAVAFPRAEPFGSAFVTSGDFDHILDRVTLEVVRRLNRIVNGHFDEARRLEQEGIPCQAIEEHLCFLFGTTDFDTPQAEEANQFIVAALHFSVLDWLWGEPEVALVESGPLVRRLPLGFRPASGEGGSDALPRTIVCLRDGSEMMLVPGGTERIGNDDGPPDERPAHRVALGDFYIDKLETSVAQYERFLAATGYPVPSADHSKEGSQWDGRVAKKDAAQMPVVHVNWYDARSYAQWCGKSLPSEAQWERAARGRFSADFPRSADPSFARHVNAGRGSGSAVHGSAINQRSVIDDESQAVLGGIAFLMSVYSFPAAINPYGCQNMLGNVAEWCRDWFAPDYYSNSTDEEPLGPDSGELRVVRGGSWRTPIEQLGAAHRTGLSPTSRSSTVGIRCVLRLPVAP